VVVDVNSNAYYVLEEEKDEGPFYVFQLPDNKVLSFGGQDFYEDENFPNNKFEIVEGRGLKNELLIFTVYNYGDKIEPKKIIRGKEKWNLPGSRHYPDPERFTIVKGRIEDFITGLLHK
jgi:hypothetical protein